MATETLRLPPPLVQSCVGGARQAEVSTVVELSELTVADVEADTCAPLVLSCVGGSMPTVVM